MIDRAVFDGLAAAMGEEVLPRLLRQFVIDVRPRVERAVAACGQGDLTAAGADAHDAKSMSSTFGLMALAHTAEMVEQACRCGDAAAAAAASREFPARLVEALTAIGLE